MNELKEFFNGLNNVEWILIVLGLYLSIFTHKAVKIIKEMRTDND